MSMSSLLEQSSRIALAAFLHDLGKFAERARIPVNSQILEDNKQLYCPHPKAFTDAKGYFTHVHAAYTGLAMDLIEDYLPDLTGTDFAPFGSWKTKDADDSFINAAAKHHKPETFLQWIIATADRVASGFDREEFEVYNQGEDITRTGKNHYTARQMTLFEQINKENLEKRQFDYRYPLKPLSPDSIFPVEAEEYEHNDKDKAQQEYLELWQGFTQALKKIPQSHRGNWSLWLDHFETAWGVYTQAIPSATAFNVRPDVSLYDHSRVTAALATALWRFHHEKNQTDDNARKQLSDQTESWREKKFLLVQGDFFGIQDFIFASSGETNKRAAKLLRGRSFYVSLLTECAALKVLDVLDLPSTSQVINAAGKFMIVAPNTDQTKAKLQQVQNELDQWFLAHSFGQAGVGLAWTEACCNNFRRKTGNQANEKSPYRQLIDRLFAQMEIKKCQRFDLCNNERIVFDGFLDEFEYGECKIDGRSPAKVQKDGEWISNLANDQIDIGSWLVKSNKQRILITRKPLREDKKLSTLSLTIFGYALSFTDDESAKGEFGAEVRNGNLLRVWDFSLPKSADKALWNGYARRNINAYVPIASATDLLEEQWDKYIGIEEKLEIDAAKTLNHLACANRRQDESGKWIGISALSTLKGDVDNLGSIFESGLGDDASFSKTAALSRQLNNFFTVYLPWLCQHEFPDTYTVFAGGDDFFLIGPWLSQIKLSKQMWQAFQKYVANNEHVHFSAGISTTKPGLPINQIGDLAEQALEQAKAHNPEKADIPPKNAVTCFGQTMSWVEFQELLTQRLPRLQSLVEENALSTGYVYGLLHLIDMAERVGEKPENALWHSYFAYRTARMLERNKKFDKDQRKIRQAELAQEIAVAGIREYGGNYRVALFCHLYQQRD
ncbi:type III-A CRISPR-associated protein Cas10/Csm1 [Nitrosomonas sp. sh817]|uniref:type III-A CRISPR-associated protein Cas10/Csm1 n=1 Tax=Nitrosomonas sp. sh817 TaxID=3070658 RepID=UPI0027DCF12B|nr:type III-A CRISPR-associated protein Cas10/Csm1 [Nitrosomonas sp. sh817]WMJ08251.1 type III-A CRISPR-associated protein Cas10/Csm1 [Nitrosomonas sp. sh817]